ncbi:hypothetical protein EDD11_006235 [Mortierella claussenii]|nr:hypothetical protein EDD11_006235 [Mortierella claussenii]
MGDSTNAANQANTTGKSSTAGPASVASESKKTVIPKLNPDAKDYIPRTPIAQQSSEGGAGSSSVNSGNHGGNPRNHRRRRNGGGNDTHHGNSNKPSERESGGNNNTHTQSVVSSSSNGNSTNINNRNRRKRAAKQTTDGGSSSNRNGGGARIDDYHEDDDIEINMDRPADLPLPSSAEGQSQRQSQPNGLDPNTAGKDRRRDSRRKGKEVLQAGSSGTTAPSRPAQQQQNRGDNKAGRSKKVAVDGQPESSSSSSRRNNTDHSNNAEGSRRQRNRRTGDLGGRTFPSATNGTSTGPNGVVRTEEGSGAQRHMQTGSSRQRGVYQPKKFVHTVEEDRDLMAALTAGLTNSTYDCMVCWDVIRPAHKVWNCQVCWAAFHLDCLSTWAKKSSEVLQGGDVQDAKTAKCRSQRNMYASVERSATRISTDTSLPIRVESFVVGLEIALTLVTFRAILAHVLHAAVLAPFSHAIVETNHSSCAVSIRTSHSRLASLVARFAENFWDAESTRAHRSVMLDRAHPAKKQRSRCAIAVNTIVKRVAVMESPEPLRLKARNELGFMSATRSVIDLLPVAIMSAPKLVIL